MRDRLLRGALIVVALTSLLFAGYELTQPKLITVPESDIAGALPVIVGRIDASPEAPSAGDRVTFRVQISADRAMTFRRIAVRVQDPTGRTRDLDGPSAYVVGTSSQEFEVTTQPASAGLYRYWLVYDETGVWVSMEPFLALYVR